MKTKTKTKTLTAKIKVPFIEIVDDFHDIDRRNDELSEFFNVRMQEVAADGNYYAICYEIGNKPNKETIKEMLIEKGFDFEIGDIYSL